MAVREKKAKGRDDDAVAPPPGRAAAIVSREAEAGGVLIIDLAALAANWTTLSRRVLPAECAAVVKADAYGCGLTQVTDALARAGCRTFFVAHLAEAREVRAAAPSAVIYVLNGIPPGTTAPFAEIDARPVIGSLSELAEWDGFRSTAGWQGQAALHLDTGMNRLGLAPQEAQALAPRLRSPDHGVSLVMSHLACAEVSSHPQNLRQIQLFRELRTLYRDVPASLANSSGIFLGPTAHHDMVRTGLALYGGNPTPGLANPMKPVVTLSGRVIQVRQVAPGQSVGYGAAWTAAQPSAVAIVSVGYGDGYLRALPPTAAGEGGAALAQVVAGGKRCPIVGRISMDLMAVDVTALGISAPRRGDRVTLLGDGISLEDVAEWSGAIAYEVLAGLGARYARVYQRQEAAATEAASAVAVDTAVADGAPASAPVTMQAEMADAAAPAD